MARISLPKIAGFRRAFYKPNGKPKLDELYTEEQVMAKYGPKLSSNPIYAQAQNARAYRVLSALGKEAEASLLPWIAWKPGPQKPKHYGITSDIDKFGSYRTERRRRLDSQQKRMKTIDTTYKQQYLLLGPERIPA